jgi:glycine/D-amino acid oxidase-like deaminating enzyme
MVITATLIGRRQAAALLLGGFAGACATPRGGLDAGWSAPLPPAAERLRLAPVWVSEDRVIRVVAGLRPYRPGGFVVRAERRDAKVLVHNYGHGGGGVTLSWGTADQAVDLGFNPPVRDYAVIGCGAVGLATARLLQRRGGQVTIYARDLPPDTTSNIAGGKWWPTSVYSAHVATPAFLEQFDDASRRAYRQFQTMVGGGYGVSWRRNYVVTDQPFEPGPLTQRLAPLAPEARELKPGEHPFGSRWVHQYDTLMIEPPIYLQAVLEDFQTAGGRLVVGELASWEAVRALPQAVVFNCTGLGAKALFGDEELTPVKGQLVVLLPQPEVTYNVLSDDIYMFPRADGVILGGTFEHGVWDLAPDPAVTARILAKHKALFAGLAAQDRNSPGT